MFHVEFKALPFGFEFSPIAFEIFGKPVYWYGIIITLGIILSVAYAFYRAKKFGVSIDDMYDYTIFVIIFGVIGARLYYVLSNLDSYKTFFDIINIPAGGLGIYGGIIGGVIAVLAVSLFKKKNPIKILDIAAPATMIGQFIGRWGNFTNQEAFGINTTLPWGMKSYVVGTNENGFIGTREYLTRYYSKLQVENPDLQISVNGYVHPTFLYESVWNLIGFVIIHFTYKKQKFTGQMALMYITWYGLGRMFIEGLRTDSLYITGTSIRKSQLLAFLCFVIGLTLLIVLFIVTCVKEKKLMSAALAEGIDPSDELMQLDAIDTESENVNELCELDGEKCEPQVCEEGESQTCEECEVQATDTECDECTCGECENDTTQSIDEEEKSDGENN